MRSRSITGPLILILIGAVFLVNNIRPDLISLSGIADYWPFLLIAAGIIGLVEVLYNASRGAPPPRPVAGAGIFWILILGLVISTLGRSHTFRFGNFAPGVSVFGSDYDYDVNATASTRGVTRVVLDNLRGDISIKSEDAGKSENTGDVKVTGRKTVRAFNRGEADRTDQQTRIRIDRDGDSLVIRAGDAIGPRLIQITDELEIAVPPGVGVESRGRVGDLSIEGVEGPVDITAGRGDVQLTRVANNVKIEASRNGDIHAVDVKGSFDLEGRGGDIQLENIGGPVSIHGEYSGTLDFRSIAQPLRFNSSRTEFSAEAVPGVVTMDLGNLKLSNVAGPVAFKTGTRDIQAADVTGALDLSVDRGDITVNAGKSPALKMDIRTRVGDVTVTLPDGAGFDLKGSTARGDIENDYGPALETQDSGRGATIQSRSGNGPAVRVTTFRGTLSIKKS